MKAADLVQNAFAMPLISSWLARRSYRYSTREHLTVTYRSNRAELVP
jgi:acetoacetate decarboxylase